MRAGKLDRTIVIQRSTHETDDFGSPAFTWTDIATLRAEILQSGSVEFIRAYGAADETTTIFRTRFVDSVTPADRIVFDGGHHDIKEVTEIQRRRGLEIRAIRPGDA